MLAGGGSGGRDPRDPVSPTSPPQSSRPASRSSPPPAWSFVCSRHFPSAVTPASGGQRRAPTVLPAADPTDRPPERPSPGDPPGRSRSCRLLSWGAWPGAAVLRTVRVCGTTDTVPHTPRVTTTHAHPRGVTAPSGLSRHRGPPRPGQVMAAAGTLCQRQGCCALGRDATRGAGALRTPLPGAGRARGSGAVAGSASPSQCGQRPGQCRRDTRVRPRSGKGRGAAAPAVGRGTHPRSGRAPHQHPNLPQPAGIPHGDRTAAVPVRAPASHRTPTRRRSPGDLARRPVSVPGPRRAAGPPSRPVRGARGRRR